MFIVTEYAALNVVVFSRKDDFEKTAEASHYIIIIRYVHANETRTMNKFQWSKLTFQLRLLILESHQCIKT